MKFRVLGSDMQTGERVELPVEADGLEEAAAHVRRLGVAITAVAHADLEGVDGLDPVQPAIQCDLGEVPRFRATRLDPRSWSRDLEFSTPKLIVCAALILIPLGALAPAFYVFVGALALGTGVAIGVVPALREWFGNRFRLAGNKRDGGGIETVLFGGYGAFLALVGLWGIAIHGESFAEQALRAERLGNADERVASLIAQARSHVAAGEFDDAQQLADEALAIEGASDLREAGDLRRRIARSGDPEHLLGVLVALTPEEFAAFRSGDSLPRGLDFDNDVLTARAVEIALARMDRVVGERAGRSTLKAGVLPAGAGSTLGGD